MSMEPIAKRASRLIRWARLDEPKPQCAADMSESIAYESRGIINTELLIYIEVERQLTGRRLDAAKV